jgi:hypothetical protein
MVPLFGTTLPTCLQQSREEYSRMKKILYALFGACVAPAFAADLGVSISIGQPGFYGQLDIGNFPQPQLVYPQPIVIRQSPEFVSAQPIYLHVPPGHERHWSKHCAQYNACGRPVYFVRDDWYNNEYVPRYRQRGGNDDDHHRGHGHGQDRDKGHGHDEGHDRQDR